MTASQNYGLALSDYHSAPASRMPNVNLNATRRLAELEWFESQSQPGGGGNAMASQQAEAFERAAAGRAAAAAEEAATNKAATEASIKTARDATSKATGYLEPWRTAGIDALGKIQEKIDTGPGDFEASPGYQFRLDEGTKALERAASAKGNVLGGATQKAITRYAQNYATDDYDNFLRRYYESFTPLDKLSGNGMSAAERMGGYEMTGSGQEIAARTTGTGAQTNAMRYGADATALGIEAGANILAADQAAQDEKDYAYETWKSGEAA